MLLTGRLEGIGWYKYETLRRITLAHPEHRFYFIFDRSWSEEFIFSENVTPVKLFPPTRHPVLWYIWFEWSLPRLLKKLKVDLFLSPDGYLSLKTRIPSIAVIHDLNFHHRPEDLPYLVGLYYRHFFPRYARKAVRIVTVSEFSKKDIAQVYQIPQARIDITPNGANPLYKPLQEGEIAEVRERYTGRKPYFIFIGALHPRKNLPRLLQAYEMFRQQTGLDWKLMIVGGRMFGNRELEQVLLKMEYQSDVIFTGRLPAEELHQVLGAAYALVFVPLFEGFGIPLIESMYCDVPVITSNVTSMPEVAGDAAVYADPLITDSIAGAMINLAANQGLYQDLIMKSRLRRQLYSWDITAEKLWESIEKAMHTASVL